MSEIIKLIVDTGCGCDSDCDQTCQASKAENEWNHIQSELTRLREENRELRDMNIGFTDEMLKLWSAIGKPNTEKSGKTVIEFTIDRITELERENKILIKMDQWANAFKTDTDAVHKMATEAIDARDRIKSLETAARWVPVGEAIGMNILDQVNQEWRGVFDVEHNKIRPTHFRPLTPESTRTCIDGRSHVYGPESKNCMQCGKPPGNEVTR